MYRIITPARMQAMEQAFMQSTGTPGLLLMERAAQALVQALLRMTDGGAVFFCGPGNNGGDGYAAAALYAAWGRKAWLWTLCDPSQLTGDARANWQRCVRLGLPVTWLDALPQAPPPGCGAVVDALFGTGLARPLTGLYAQAVAWINACGLPVLAVDMPSGTAEGMVRADATVAFHRMKPAHALLPGRVNAGTVTVADIGLPQEAFADDFEVLTPEDVPGLLPVRALDTHKGTAGHALLLAGSTGMAGAAGLCANAAMRGGAGLVTVCCPDDVLPVMQALAPCATCVTHGGFAAALQGKSALALGPGLGQGEAVAPLLLAALAAPLPQVWDADALNWLARHPRALGAHCVLTPHPGEAARLLGASVADVTADPIAAAEALATRYGATVLLKGATTVITGQGRRALNVVGTPGMATGGSGDVLTGLIAALLAQKEAPFDAAQKAALLHGMAGIRAAQARGVRSLTAWDIMEALHID